MVGLLAGGELSVCCVAMRRPLPLSPLSPVSPLDSGTRWSTVELRTRVANDSSVFAITEKDPNRAFSLLIESAYYTFTIHI